MPSDFVGDAAADLDAELSTACHRPGSLRPSAAVDRAAPTTAIRPIIIGAPDSTQSGPFGQLDYRPLLTVAITRSSSPGANDGFLGQNRREKRFLTPHGVKNAGNEKTPSPCGGTSSRCHHPPPSAWNSAAVSANRAAEAWTRAIRVCS